MVGWTLKDPRRTPHGRRSARTSPSAPGSSGRRWAHRSWVGADHPAAVDLDACVACGLCLPHCPTYRLTGEESASPRGRIAAMRAVADGAAAVDDRFREFTDLCLVCRACEDVCPSHVPFGRMMEHARTETEALRPWSHRAGAPPGARRDAPAQEAALGGGPLPTARDPVPPEARPRHHPAPERAVPTDAGGDRAAGGRGAPRLGGPVDGLRAGSVVPRREPRERARAGPQRLDRHDPPRAASAAAPCPPTTAGWGPPAAWRAATRRRSPAPMP